MLYSNVFHQILDFSVHSFSCVQLFAKPWTAAHQVTMSITNSQSLLKLISIDLVMPSNYLILCPPLLLLPSIFPSIQTVFQWGNSSHQVAKVLECPSNEYSGLISFRIDWFDLSIQVTLKSLLQHHRSKASNLWCSAFFIVQFSPMYVTIGKTIALTRWTFVGKVVFLLFNMLSRFVVDFLPRSIF